MKRALINNNKENLFPHGDRYNSQGKLARDEIVLKSTKNK